MSHRRESTPDPLCVFDAEDDATPARSNRRLCSGTALDSPVADGLRAAECSVVTIVEQGWIVAESLRGDDDRVISLRIQKR